MDKNVQALACGIEQTVKSVHAWQLDCVDEMAEFGSALQGYKQALQSQKLINLNVKRTLKDHEVRITNVERRGCTVCHSLHRPPSSLLPLAQDRSAPPSA